MIAIVDYNAGNVTSVLRAVQHLGFEAEITSNLERIQSAQKIIFPGVGAAKATMVELQKRGLDLLLQESFRSGTPMLGICIGIQILFERSSEEDTNCLGLLSGQVEQFSASYDYKVPQIGWNTVRQAQSPWIFAGIPDRSYFYFVNSYYPIPSDNEIQIGYTHYKVDFCSVVAKKNLVATQFHLEKSGTVGLKMLDNFLKYCPY